MGLLDRLRGSPEDRFAKRMLALFHAAGVPDAWYDRDQFAIGYRLAPGDKPGWAFLSNVYHEAKGEHDDERLRRFVQTIVGHEGIPETWDEARPLLRSVVRSATFGLAGPPGSRAPLSRPILPFLAEFVVVDQPTSMAYLTVETLRDWAISPADAFAAARANLAALGGPPDDEPSGGAALLRFVDDGDAYFVSRLLVDGWLAALGPRVGGRPVAFIPDHHSLIVAGDGAGLGGLFEMIEKHYLEAARSISPAAYTVDSTGRVVPFTVPDGDPLAPAVTRAEAILAGSEYEAQTQHLRQAYEDGQIDVYVASLIVSARPDGHVASMASWTEGVDTLLPRADFVAFTATNDEPFFVPWPVVAAELALTPEDGFTPERYRLRSWPAPATMDTLRAHAVNP